MASKMTEMKWVELHSPLFLAGTNLSQKLDPTKRSGLHMAFDEDKRHLYVTYNNHTARVPEMSILSMVEGVVPVKVAPAPSPFRATNAQVSTPMGHVFEGPGKGKT